ncbi:MAG: tetratricopeptide repeat protein [Planctomycetes bacterium]|nr:tetratricopeptide repeat protein [Planctomycetota bacterium]
MGKIRIQCSECGHEARVPEQFRSKKVRCLRCHAKLRVPEDAPVEGGSKPQTAERGREPSSPRPVQRDRGRPRAGVGEATRGGPSSKTRREAMQVLRELLHEYDHAIESVPRGFEIDLRGVALGLARQLVEEMLMCRAIRDVKLAGGTGECRIVVSLHGHAFDPEDSFAADDDDTEVFQRAPASGHGPVALNVVAPDEHSDPTRHLDEEFGFGGGAESAMQPLFSSPQSTGRGPTEPVALFQRAKELIDEGEPGEAIPLLERAIKADMNFARAVTALGKAYASVGDYHKARRAFRHLAKLEPDDPEAHVLHAAAAVQCDRMDEARDALSRAIKIDPEYTPAYRYAAQLYERLGDQDKARKFRARYQALKLRG